MTHAVFQALEEEPFGKKWYVWCHPETLHELRDECQSMRTEDNPIPPTPEERFGREFKADRLLPKGEYFALPDKIKYFDELTCLKHPPGELVEQVVEYCGPKSYRKQEAFENVIRVRLPFKLEFVEYRFLHDALDIEIPVLQRLIDKHIPKDHPPVDPRSVEWETADDLEVNAGVEIDGDTYWVWRETDPKMTTVPFTYSVSDRELVEYSERFFIDQAERAFVESATDAIGTERTDTLISRRHEMADTEFSQTLSEGSADDELSYEIEEVEVGHKVMKTDALVMNRKISQLE